MPRVLLPDTTDPYLGTGVRPIVTGTSKRDVFETLPRVMQLGEALGSSQALGALVNLGEAGVEKLQQASQAAKARQAQLDTEQAAQEAQARQDSDAYYEQRWREFQAQPTLGAMEEARRVGIGADAQSLARKDEEGAPIIGQRMDWSPDVARRVTPVYPKAPALPPENPPLAPTPPGAQAPARSPKVAALLQQYNAIVDYLKENPDQRSNPLHGARLDSLKAEIDQEIAAENAAARAQYRQQAAAHAQQVTDISRRQEERAAAQADAVQGAGQRRAQDLARYARERAYNGDAVSAYGREHDVELTPEQQERLRSALRIELMERGPEAAKALADRVRAAWRARGTTPAAAPAAAPAPEVDDSGARLDPRTLPRQTREGVPPTAEADFYSVSRGLPPERGAVSAPPAVSGRGVPLDLSGAKSYADFAALARQAQTAEQQSQLLQAAKQAGAFKPRTLFDRLSGDHEARGMRELTNLFPSRDSDLGWARLKQQQEQSAEMQRYREAEARRKAAAGTREHERKVGESQRKAAEEKAKLDQRVSEFEFESGAKFEETKRHHKETERIGWAQAKNNINKADREAKNSPDLKGALDVYKGRASALDKEEQESVEKAQTAEREAQAAEAAAVQAVRAARTAPPPTSRRDTEGAKNKSAAENEARDAARAAKAKRAAAVEAKKQHDAAWGIGSAKRAERDGMRKRVDAISQELEKRGKMPAAEE